MAERPPPIMSYAAYMNAPTAGFDTTDDELNASSPETEQPLSATAPTG